MADVEAPEVEQEVEGAIDALIDEGEESPDEGEESPDEETPTVEELAQDLGWKPQEDFQGENYVGAAKYIRRSKDINKNLGNRLKETNRKLTSVEGSIQGIKAHYEANTKAQAIQYEKQLGELRQQRVEAIEEGDTERVDAVESEMADIYETTSRRPPPSNDVQVDPEEEEAFEDWMGENSWYSKGGNQEMMKYADDLADLPENKILPYERKLKFVTARIKEVFPENFKPTPRAAPNPVEAPSRGSSKRRYSSRDLNPEQKNGDEEFNC